MIAIITTEQVLEIITTEDIVDILVNDLGSEYPKQNGDNLLFTTVCHCGHKHKLHYITDAKFFMCYTNCGSMSIFDLYMQVKNISFKEAFNYICKYKNIDVNKKQIGLITRNSNNDLDFLNNHLYKTKKMDIKLPSYNNNVMNIFDDYVPSSWIKEGIKEDIMKYFGVKFYFNQYKAIIPHLDYNGNLVGLQSRNFIQSEIECGRKYVPITIQNLTYRYPTHFNLYGLYQNKENIKRLKRVIIFESPKSVWLYGTYYGQENNIALASCGLTLSSYQRDILLSLGVEEVVIAWDKQYNLAILNNGDRRTKEYKEYQNYIKSIKKAVGLFIRYCETSVILDWENDGERINYKDAPIDNGKDIFEELFKERYLIEDKEELEELL